MWRSALCVMLIHILKIHCNGQYTSISNFWSDDYSLTASSTSGTGWYEVDDSGNIYSTIIDGELNQYHGPFIGDGVGGSDYETYNVSRGFFCDTKSSVSIVFNIVLCSTETGDSTTLYLNGEYTESIELLRSKNGGTGYSINDSVLSSINECTKWEMMEMGPYTLPDVAINEVFTLKFSTLVNFGEDSVAITGIEITCTTIPTLQPTTSPTTKAPTLSPSLPTMPPTIAPTALPTSTPTTGVPTTSTPTIVPTAAPTEMPTASTLTPSTAPTMFPSKVPTVSPSVAPTSPPTNAPTSVPTQPEGEITESTLSSTTFEPDEGLSTTHDSDSNGESREGISISIDMLQEWLPWILTFVAGACACCIVLILCLKCRGSTLSSSTKRRRHKRSSMEHAPCKSREEIDFPTDGREDNSNESGQSNNTTYSRTKKSTYSTVSRHSGDGEELFIEHAQDHQEMISLQIVQGIGNQAAALAKKRLNPGHIGIGHKSKHVPPPPPVAMVPSGSFEELNGAPQGPHSSSFKRNIRNESLAVDSMMNDIVNHMATPNGPESHHSEGVLYD